MISQYSVFNSEPFHFRSNASATAYVVPEPPVDLKVHQYAPGKECPEKGMQEEEGIPGAPDWTCIEKPADLAIPKEEPYPGNTCPPENYFFRMRIKLEIQANQLRENEHKQQHSGYPPSDSEKLIKFLF